MPSVVLSGLKAIVSKVGGPAGYLGKAVISVLEDIVNDFDALKATTAALGASIDDQTERINKLEARARDVEAAFEQLIHRLGPYR